MTSSSSCLAVHLVMQTVAEAGLNTLGSAGWSPASELCEKVAFFLFCKMFVSHRHQHRRLPEKHLSASPCLIQQCKRLPIQFSSDKLWILKSWKEKWKLIRKKPWTAYLFFIWWSKNQWDEQNSISLSCLFFLSWLPWFFLLKNNKNKIYIHIYFSEGNVKLIHLTNYKSLLFCSSFLVLAITLCNDAWFVTSM